MINSMRTVRCEKLIFVLKEPVDERFPEFSEWWGDYIEDDEALFAEELRIEAVEQSSVLQKAEGAFDKGFEPIIFSPNRTTDDKVFNSLGKFSTYVSRLVAGHDDTAIRHFLQHPSLETVQAYAGHGQLIYPSSEYKELFEKDIKYDTFAQTILEKLKLKKILITDFRILDDVEEEITQPDFIDRFDFEWYLDEQRTVQIDFNERSGNVYLYHRFDGEPCVDPIWGEPDGSLFEFDQNGMCTLTGNQLSKARDIAQIFDLEEKHQNWRNEEEKPTLFETEFLAMAAADNEGTIAGERKDQSGEWTLRIFTDRDTPEEGYVLLEVCKERIKEFEGKTVTLDIGAKKLFLGEIHDGETGKEIITEGLDTDVAWNLKISE